MQSEFIAGFFGRKATLCVVATVTECVRGMLLMHRAENGDRNGDSSEIYSVIIDTRIKYTPAIKLYSDKSQAIMLRQAQHRRKRQIFVGNFYNPISKLISFLILLS
jgi:hypothetical protein